jgi:hypothetical protein
MSLIHENGPFTHIITKSQDRSPSSSGITERKPHKEGAIIQNTPLRGTSERRRIGELDLPGQSSVIKQLQ